MFCAIAEEGMGRLRPAEHYLEHPEELPAGETARWFVLNRIRRLAQDGKLQRFAGGAVSQFLRTLSQEHRLLVLEDMVPVWGQLGADDIMLETLYDVTGVKPCDPKPTKKRSTPSRKRSAG
jgi:hypothetical protein